MKIAQFQPDFGPQQLASALTPAISSIGNKNFDSGLVQFLHKLLGVDHMALMHLSKGSMRGLLTSGIDHAEENYQQMFLYTNENLWVRDPAYETAKELVVSKKFAAVGTNLLGLDDRRLREDVYGRRGIKYRAMLCSQIDDGMAVLAICSSKSNLSSRENLALMENNSKVIFSLITKHIGISSRKFDTSEAFRSVEEIESVLTDGMSSMPIREVQVCSRAIFGMSSLDISAELGISRETIATYRKRAYSRLGIATQRELLLWYLMLWGEVRGKYLAGHIGTLWSQASTSNLLM